MSGLCHRNVVGSWPTTLVSAHQGCTPTGWERDTEVLKGVDIPKVSQQSQGGAWIQIQAILSFYKLALIWEPFEVDLDGCIEVHYIGIY